MINADKIIEEAQKLASSKPIQKDASFVLKNLLAQIEEVDFYSEAFPGIKKLREKQKNIDDQDKLSEIQKKIDSFKLYQKHYLIITVEKLLEVARNNSWDLCQRLAYYYVYNGEFWHVLDEKELASFLGKVAEKMGVPKFDSRHYEFKDKLFKQFEASAHLPEPEIDEDTVLINLRNGTFEITPKGQKLREFDPEDFMTYQLPFKYTPEASAPIFERYLSEVLPDEESQTVLAEFMGYIFLRNLKLEKVLFLYGSGRNGKSVMFDIIKAMLGENNMSYYGLQSLTDDNGYYRAKLVNKLVNWASDVGDKLQSNTFKQLASGEPIEARLPYKEPFQLTNICKFAFNTNTLPADVEHTDAFFERFLIIPFDQYIEPERRDPKLAEKIIQNELPGVFNWVLAGLNRLIEQEGFSPCEASNKVLKDFRKESDSVALFMDDIGYKADPESWTQAKPVYQSYREWCFSEGLKPLSKKNMLKRCDALGLFTSTKNVGKVIHIKKHQLNGTH